MDLDLMINSLPKLLSATLTTLKLLSLSLIFGLIIGLIFAIMRLSKNKFVSNFSYGFPFEEPCGALWSPMELEAAKVNFLMFFPLRPQPPNSISKKKGPRPQPGQRLQRPLKIFRNGTNLCKFEATRQRGNGGAKVHLDRSWPKGG